MERSGGLVGHKQDRNAWRGRRSGHAKHHIVGRRRRWRRLFGSIERRGPLWHDHNPNWDRRRGGDGKAPWFFEGGRKIPNISSFKVPDYAVITNRVARHAGIAFIGVFDGDDRRFAITTDARLVPTSKLKPERGSTFHGVEMNKGWQLPLGFVTNHDGATTYDVAERSFKKVGELAYHKPIQLTGKATKFGEDRLVEAKDGTWLKSEDLATAVKTSELPPFAKGDKKWIHSC